MDLNDSIELCFLIAGHTKNVCDGAFGHVKGRLNETNTHTPSDMMIVIENSSSTTKCVPSVHVDWKDWKTMLSTQFRIPSVLAITKFHVFTFRKDSLGCVSCRRLSMEEISKSFALTSMETSESFRREWATRMRQEDYESLMVLLDDIASAKHKTRKQYLEVNILDRYYANDCDMRQNFSVVV
ncbi:hypothetical protein BWQ96_07837 [Gracilariopsis chorda]|uniref:DUF7869 domain-containing protein n=1 Tax=Gracilariopsis chorda TaxID=448386 RepID=A0A2V3IK82_9FLOR|nr:hypothetical protein BWQ96_07837 [Gracilariopsis chorda]|eukprot:PXF42459.1 hypothetical protein BWQ96_07837 [Gracilariopsis chorda]